MDFNLSSICEMLAERIEEYKTTSKKRRLKRGSAAAKAKKAKFSRDNQTKNILLTNGTRMYASTPIETPKTESERFPATVIFSSIDELSTTAVDGATEGRLSRNLNTNTRELTFDEEDSTELKKASVGESPVSFSSVTKTSLETLKRRRIQRPNVNARRLFADEDDESDDECSSRDSVNHAEYKNDECSFKDSAYHEEYKNDECSHKDSANHEEYKNDECSSKDSHSETSLVKTILTPLYTPKRPRLSRERMNTRRLTFDDEVNEDTSVYNSFSNECSTEEKDQDLVKCLPNDCVESTLVPDSEEMDYSTLMVLNVGILIRPLRH